MVDTQTLLDSGKLPLPELARIAIREGQSSSPIYRVHRWFARRLGSQFRALLTGLSLSEQQAGEFWERYSGEIDLSGTTILDPFVGGGTSLVEASRCGAKVIGIDIDPVAAEITRIELSGGARMTLSGALTDLQETVGERISRFHRAMLDTGELRVVLHHFWVQVKQCPKCESLVEAHPHYQLAYDKAKDIQWAFCRVCSQIQGLPFARKELWCECGSRTRIRKGSLSHTKLNCPHCRHSFPVADASAPPAWQLFAQEYIEPGQGRPARKFKTVSSADLLLYEESAALLDAIEKSDGELTPDRPIPDTGRWDRRPLIHGVQNYGQLFNKRQLLHLTLLGARIRDWPEQAEREALTTAFSEHLTTNCMYAGYAFGYRRISPLFSFHAFRHITRPVELNPWLDGIGRGTFPNAVRKLQRAFDHCRRPRDLLPQGKRKRSKQAVGPTDGRVADQGAAVTTGSVDAAVETGSARVVLRKLTDESIDLILTDPPYYDNVSYSELSDFYLAWRQAIGNLTEHGSGDSLIAANLAATSRSAESLQDYENALGEILRECTRVLRADGRMVFTYHHTYEGAWLALGKALLSTGLWCRTAFPMRSEGQGGLHSFDGTLRWDVAMVLTKKQPIVAPAPLDLRARLTEAATELRPIPKVLFGEHELLNLAQALVIARATRDPTFPLSAESLATARDVAQAVWLETACEN